MANTYNDFSAIIAQDYTAIGKEFSLGTETFDEIEGYVQTLVLLKKCCALANAELKILDEAYAQSIILVCDKILDNTLSFQLELTIYSEPAFILNGMVNEFIALKANEHLKETGLSSGIDPIKHVNMSQGCADIIATTNIVYIHNRVSQVRDAIMQLENALTEKESEFKDIIKMGRIDLQDALPISLGQVFSGYRAQVSGIRENLDFELQKPLASLLGASYVGTGFGCVSQFKEHVSTIISTHFNQQIRPAKNMFALLQEGCCELILHAHLQHLAITVGRIAKDCILMTSGPHCGFGDIRIPAAQPGSSIMPGKINPVVPDMFVMIAHKVSANHAGIAYTAFEGEFDGGCNTAMIIKYFHESTQLLTRGISIFSSKVIEGITAREKHSLSKVQEATTPIFLTLCMLFGRETAMKLQKLAQQNTTTLLQEIHASKLLPSKDIEHLFCIEDMVHPEKTSLLFAKYLPSNKIYINK